jgi:menaquinone-9 beta-reductase
MTLPESAATHHPLFDVAGDSAPLPTRTQVLVVGGGPAGASAAWHCRAAGLDVVLVDKAHFPRAKACAEYVGPGALPILERMGALGAIEAGGAARLAGMVVHTPNGGRIHGEFSGRHPFRGIRDGGLGVQRQLLDPLLLERARAAGVQVVEGLALHRVLQDQGVVVGAELHERGATRETHTIRADLVIGADGLRSVVSRQLQLAHRARWPRRYAFVAHFDGVADMGAMGEMHVRRDGYVGLAQVSGGVTNVALVLGARAAKHAAGNPEALQRAWLDADPALAARFRHATRVTPVRTTGPFGSFAKRAWHPGALLTGDAADFFDPFTGEGIKSALKGGELLVQHAVDALRAPHAQASRRALAAYDDTRRRALRGKWWIERLIGMAVAAPPLLDHFGRTMSRRPELADLLVGATGGVVPPRAVLHPATLWRFVTGAASPQT